MAPTIGFASDREENILGKGENAGFQHFLLFLKCFQKPFLKAFCLEADCLRVIRTQKCVIKGFQTRTSYKLLKEELTSEK